MAQGTIRILIADDHEMVRIGLTTLLRVFPELELVGEAVDGQSAIEMCDIHHPNLVLMDINMPGMDGIQATRAIHERHPDIKVLTLTALMQERVIQQALQAGAVGYVLKNITPEELMYAIHAAIAGHFTLSPQVAQLLLEMSHPQQKPDLGLTEREMEVLALMIEGLNNNAIAQRIHVSAATVKSHVSNILSKLSVSSRAEAVALAMRLGFLA